MRRENYRKLLIVDDDADDRETLRDAFIANRHHHDVVMLSDGDQLLNHLEEDNSLDHSSALILLDLNMPVKDGMQVLREIKSNYTFRSIPVIMVTTSNSERDKESSYKAGANCFVTKPDSYSELMNLTDCIAKLWLNQ